MHDLPTMGVSPTWFLAPYCAWLGYGELDYLSLALVKTNKRRGELM